jgi:polyhydroxyalkanoate synthesis regulator phasin
MARAAKKQTVIDDMSEVLDEAAERAEGALNRGWEVAFEVLPERAEKLVRDLTKQTRKVSGDLAKRGKQTTKRLEKAVSDFDKQRQRFAKRAEKRIDGVVGAMERRITGAVEVVERNMADAVRPVAQRLDLASYSEVTSLKRRLSKIEKQVGAKPARATGPRRKYTRKAS